MSYVFFEDVLSEIGHKLIYDAIVNYAGNSFCDKSWDMITKNNPLNVQRDAKGKANASMNTLASFFNSADVKIRKKDKGDNDGKGNTRFE